MDSSITSRRAAENQSTYRSVNERLKDLNEAFEAAAAIGSEWVCECLDTECSNRISATPDEYETVRADPRTFIVYPGHVYPEFERVVRSNERFAVVEKIGAAGEVSDELDPRNND